MNRHWKIRAATPRDSQAVERLLFRCYGQLLIADYGSEYIARALPIVSKPRPELLESATFYLVLTSDGDLAGCGGWSFTNPRSQTIDDDSGHIRHVATDPDFVRAGVATALLTHIIDEAQANSVPRLECLSTTTAAPFYARCDFVEIERIDLPIAKGLDLATIVMERPL